MTTIRLLHLKKIVLTGDVGYAKLSVVSSLYSQLIIKRSPSQKFCLFLRQLFSVCC
jgi:hypothetical protein